MTLKVKFERHFEDQSISFDIALSTQKITAVFGPSGVGKTTLLCVIAGLDNPTNSEVIFDGDIWQSSSQFVTTENRHIGFVFQQPSMFEHLNVEQNIHYGIKRRKLSIQTLQPYLNELYEILGLTPLLDRPVVNLSGGEQQRVAIARALATKPKLLLMDEPLASLDDALKQMFLAYLEQLQAILQVPIVYVSHSRDEVARLSNDVVLIDRDRGVITGNTFDIFSDLSLPLASSVNAKSVIQAQLIQHDEQHHLSLLKSDIGDLYVRKLTVALGSSIKLGIRAADVSIALSELHQTSILNVIDSEIVDWVDGKDGSVTLKLKAGCGILLSQITKRSFDDLALQKGLGVYAQIKSVALI